MSELHELCTFPIRPITSEYVTKLQYFLSNGIPATYTLEEAEAYLAGKEDEELSSTTTPLHIIATNLPSDLSEDEKKVVTELIEELFAWGAGWNLIDGKEQTPGDILFERGFKGTGFYEAIVDAGVRAELLLRKINGGEVEFLSDDEGDIVIGEEERELRRQFEEAQAQREKEQEQEQEEIPELVQEDKELDDKYNLETPAGNQETYLSTKLTYTDDALLTSANDGVMMEWEREIMKAAADTLFKTREEKDTPQEDLEEFVVLNIGFGMGIIDTLIQEKKPTKHYISEAHPDVLAKMKKDGWYEKQNVVILEGRWQETLPELLTKGVFFNGIYYDTFSEHYTDMLDLYDVVVGLLKPSGIFSFFNGLGADRQVIYDVYRKIVEIDLNNYGLNVIYKDLDAPKTTLKETDNKDESEWNGINRPYWRCETFYHPEIRFI
ncbi:hypothetical protein WICPIJ_008283 [Wickerhamomyces pijperi]|uniref:Arginine N-methyltransferase 2 n=1 Tax=Wickerhamomyces pijperi TaxID=599730 RepID=A0A9P8Q083_WICPI|nr:hypothetical protein WICPIJ_008283 [Wickerhamomyces pijperi]